MRMSVGDRRQISESRRETLVWFVGFGVLYCCGIQDTGRHAMPTHQLRVCLTLLALSLASVAIAADDYADPVLTKKEREHWAFVVPKRSTVPTVKNAAAVKLVKSAAI